MAKKVFNPFSGKWIDDPREKILQDQKQSKVIPLDSVKQEDSVTTVSTVPSVDITIGDEIVQNLLKEQDNPLELQEKLKALFSADTKTEDMFSVNGRELHEFLGIKDVYRSWFPRYVQRQNLIEGQDYKVIKEKVDVQNRTRTYEQNNHMLTLDCAKILAASQNNALGNLVLRYLIWAEKKLHQVSAVTSQQVQIPATPAMAILEIGKAMVAMEQNQNRQNTMVQNQIADLISTDSHLQEQIDQNNEAIRQIREEQTSRRNNLSVLTEERNYNPITAEGNTTTREFSEILQSLGYDMGIVKLNNYLVDNGMFQRLKKKGYKAKKRFLDLGWFVNRTEDVELPDGDIIEQYKVDITPVGRQGLLIRMENHNN